MSLVSNYTQAARLASPQNNLNKVVSGGGEDNTLTTALAPPFKNELGNALGNMYNDVKAHGIATEKHAKDHIMGVGNVEQTALSLAELNSNLEIMATALRTAVEKINELTTRSMG